MMGDMTQGCTRERLRSSARCTDASFYSPYQVTSPTCTLGGGENCPSLWRSSLVRRLQFLMAHLLFVLSSSIDDELVLLVLVRVHRRQRLIHGFTPRTPATHTTPCPHRSRDRQQHRVQCTASCCICSCRLLRGKCLAISFWAMNPTARTDYRRS